MLSYPKITFCILLYLRNAGLNYGKILKSISIYPGRLRNDLYCVEWDVKL